MIPVVILALSILGLAAVIWYYGCIGNNYSRLLHKRAEEGRALAQFVLGDAFYCGRNIPVDRVQAAAWYLKAAEQGFAKAQYELYNMLKYGDGIPEDREQADFWLRKAADKGFAWAQCELGKALLFEMPGRENCKAEAAGLFAKAARQGDGEARRYLGVMLRDGDGVKQDKAAAARLFRKACRQGEEDACLYLGFMLRDGDGIPVNKPKAAALFRGIAEWDAEAACALGEMLESGDGIAKNADSAFEYYIAAVNHPGAPSYVHKRLAHIYGTVGSSRYNQRLAFLHMEMYAQRGCPLSCEDEAWRRELEAGILPGQKSAYLRELAVYRESLILPVYTDEAERTSLFCKRAGNGDPWAAFVLGFLYEEGDGVPQDTAEACRYFALCVALAETAGGDRDRTAKLQDIKKAAASHSTMLREALASEEIAAVEAFVAKGVAGLRDESNFKVKLLSGNAD